MTLKHLFAALTVGCLLYMYSCSNTDQIVPDGFHIEDGYNLILVAQEPLIRDPVEIEFDEHGDAYVLEMPGYPFEESESRLMKLMDNDKDGVYDETIVFAEDLELASSILPYKKGFLVAAPPYLLHIADTDSDNKVDQRDTILSGFATGNLQHNYNGLSFGLDGWIYAANGGNNGKPFWWGDPSSEIDLKGNDFRFNPETKDFELLGYSSGGFELGFDDYGRMFETHNLEHISQLVFPDRYVNDLSLMSKHRLCNISNHEENGLARIYPIGEQESRVNHPEQSGYFSGACGVAHYGGGALGNLNNSVWVCDVVLNLIHVDKLVPDHSRFTADRAYEKSDFLASTDRAFRPVNLTTGPDGNMFLVDMYRDVIEHPEWIPDEIEETLDLQAGKDKGRIYKISSQDYNEDEGQFSTNPNDLISALSSSNQWKRMTAHRLLLEQELSLESQRQLIGHISSGNEFARLHAMWILHLHDKLSVRSILALLDDEKAGIRENALMIAENSTSIDIVSSRIVSGLSDSNPRVSMQAALSASLIHNYFKQQKLIEEIVKTSFKNADEYLIAARTIASHSNPMAVLQQLSLSAEDNKPFVKSLLHTYSRDSKELLAAIELIAEANLSDDDLASYLTALQVGQVDKGIKSQIASKLNSIEKKESLPILTATAALRKQLNLPLSSYFNVAVDDALKASLIKDESLDARLQNVSLLESVPFKRKQQTLFALMENDQPLDLQQRALQQLWNVNDKRVGQFLVDKWNELSPTSRSQASDVLLYKELHHDALLSGLESSQINIGEMNFDLERRRTLLWWTDNEDTKRRAEALFSDAGVVNRKEAIHNMKDALALEGSIDNGSEVFDVLCGQCHLYKDQGYDVGPVLTEINRKSKESLLHEILDPNAAVDTRYINHKVEMVNGDIHLGIIHSETDNVIQLKKLGGSSIEIKKVDIKRFASLGTSLMPEGLEGNMTNQEMADLMAFLQQS